MDSSVASALVSNVEAAALNSSGMGLEGVELLAATTGAAPVIHYPRAATIFAAIAAILFIIVGIAGNLITILALSRNLKLRVHATTTFVISLCISDLLFCSINMPLIASRYIHEEWILGEFLCSIFPFFFYGNVAASLMNMVAITVNRYVLIANYGLYDKIYRRPYLYAQVAFAWLFSFGMMLPPLLGIWGQLGLDPESFSCTILKKNGKSPKKFLFLFGLIVPMVAIICCYSAIYFKVRASRRNLAVHTSGTSGTPAKSSTQSYGAQVARKEDMRLTRMMATIFLCFMISFLPLMIVNVADDDVTIPSIHVLASVLAWASAVVNPFVYAVTNRQYRSAYKKLLSCGKHDRSHHSKSQSSRTFITDFRYHASTGEVTSPVLNNPSGPPNA